MAIDETRAARRLDALGLFLAGLINTFLAALDAVVVLGPGTAAREPALVTRALWIAEHKLRWQGGWLFWFAVTLSFAWSYYALGRNLGGARTWRDLAIGLALVAAAVDIVGVIVNLTVLPELAPELSGRPGGPDLRVQAVYQSIETLAYALVNITAFGLYSLAGLILLPALFSTPDYPRWLAWLGAAEWSIAALATILLVIAPGLATAPLLVSFALYAPWVWASGAWLLRREPLS